MLLSCTLLLIKKPDHMSVMCTTLQTNPVGAERVANIDRRTATYVAGAKVREEGVQESWLKYLIIGELCKHVEGSLKLHNITAGCMFFN